MPGAVPGAVPGTQGSAPPSPAPGTQKIHTHRGGRKRSEGSPGAETGCPQGRPRARRGPWWSWDLGRHRCEGSVYLGMWRPPGDHRGQRAEPARRLVRFRGGEVFCLPRATPMIHGRVGMPAAPLANYAEEAPPLRLAVRVHRGGSHRRQVPRCLWGRLQSQGRPRDTARRSPATGMSPPGAQTVGGQQEPGRLPTGCSRRKQDKPHEASPFSVCKDILRGARGCGPFLPSSGEPEATLKLILAPRL